MSKIVFVVLDWAQPDTWQVRIARETGDADFVFLQFADEEITNVGLIQQYAERLAHDETDIGFVWHVQGRYFTPRLFRNGLVPKTLEDYIGLTIDASKIRGLMRYRTVTSKDVGVSQPKPLVQADVEATLKARYAQTHDVRYLLPLGILQRGNAHYPEAMANLDAVAQKSVWGVARATALVHRGRIFESLGDMPHAFGNYAVASLIVPHADAHFGLGRIAFYRADYATCVEHIEAGWRVADESPDVEPWTALERDYAPAYCIARAYLHLGKHKEALVAAERGLRVRPDDLNLLVVKREATNARAKRRRRYRVVLLSESPVFTGLERALIARGHDVDRSGTMPSHDAVVVAPKACPNIPAALRLVLASKAEETVSTEEVADLFQMDAILSPSEFKTERLLQAFPFFGDKIRKIQVGIDLPPVHTLERENTFMWSGAATLGDDLLKRIKRAVPSAHIVNDLSLARLFVTTRFDATGSEVLLAQAWGALPISIAAGANREATRQGFLYEPPVNDAWIHAVTTRMVQLFHSPEATALMASQARDEMQAFSWTRVIPLWEDLFAELLS